MGSADNNLRKEICRVAYKNWLYFSNDLKLVAGVNITTSDVATSDAPLFPDDTGGVKEAKDFFETREWLPLTAIKRNILFLYNNPDLSVYQRKTNAVKLVTSLK